MTNQFDPDEAMASLLQYVQELESRIEDLKKERDRFDDTINRANARAEEAKEKEQETRLRLEQAIALKESHYDELIETMFEVPKKQLITNIKNQSRYSIVWATFATLLSIGVSFLVSYVISLNSTTSLPGLAAYNAAVVRGQTEVTELIKHNKSAKNILENQERIQATELALKEINEKLTSSVESQGQSKREVLAAIEDISDRVLQLTTLISDLSERVESPEPLKTSGDMP